MEFNFIDNSKFKDPKNLFTKKDSSKIIFSTDHESKIKVKKYILRKKKFI